MMARVRKILLAVLITTLVWVWADQALTRELGGVAVNLLVDKSTDSHLWVTFDNKNASLPITLKLSGPSAKIDILEKKLRERGTLDLDLYFNPGNENMAEPGKKYTLPLLPFVQKNRQIQEMGLQVESTSPESVDVEVVGLVNQRLVVQVFSDSRVPLADAIVEPAAIEMLVRQDYVAAGLKAAIVLTQQEIEQARVAPIRHKPVVEFAPGVTKYAEMAVKVSLPSTENLLKDYTIDETNIGYTFSPNLQGAYRVDLVNKAEILSALKIRATPDAKAAFDTVPFKLRLDINEDDPKAAGEISRSVQVNLPDEYVRKGEIKINEASDRTAKFRLIPTVSAAEKAAAAAPAPAAELSSN